MKVTFHGVRGSTPCASPEHLRYGGNTACVAVESPGEAPIVLDLGTGLSRFGLGQPVDGTFRGTALVSHIHWDHVQGLPFFPPADRIGARFDIYGPAQSGVTFAGAFAELMRPPFFPVRVEELRGDICFYDVEDAELQIGQARVLVRPVPHNGPTNGYRIDWHGVSIAYVSDHQSPLDGSMRVADSVLELCDGADLVIHDAQYTPAEWREKAHWGHCTVDYAVEVARQSGARRLALFHHDPAHDDDQVDGLACAARVLGERVGVEVMAAAEGLVVAFEPVC